ncbi:sulfite exporter TauE/SafE family protein [Candidatus Entotheonella serta]|nr:sulfite exporter TauE/SafE family protein [Candidatus Entotheonella serta]
MLSLLTALLLMKDPIMHATAIAAATLCVLFFSTLTRSTLGFGDALVAMPFLAMLLGLQTATPLVALVSTLISLMILVRNWHIVDFRMAWCLIVAAACGVPLSLFYLTRVPEPVTQTLLGLLLIGFSLYNLRRTPHTQRRVSQHTAYIFGFAAGALGGAYNTVGPMLVLYGHLRGWPPEQFRATLQSCFFPAYGSIVIGHSLAGLITPQILQYFVLSLPLVALAIYVGGRLHTAISHEHFTRYVNLALLLIGLFLCLRAYTAEAASKVPFHTRTVPPEVHQAGPLSGSSSIRKVSSACTLMG